MSSSSDLLIRNARLLEYRPAENDNGKAAAKGPQAPSFRSRITGEVDILVSGATILSIGNGLEAGGASVIDAGGCILSPGFVDMHVHLREPGGEHKEDIFSGSMAAAVGGFSAVFCMPNTEPAIDNPSVAQYVYDRGRDAGFCMVLPIGAITLGRKGEALSPMGEMSECRASVRGFSDDGSPVVDSEIMRRAMEYARTIGAIIISHSEELSLSHRGQMNEGYPATRLGLRGIPSEAEEIGVFRDIRLCEKTGCGLHLCHLSTAGSIELVRQAKRKGLPVTCEVTPHHFSLDDTMLFSYNTSLKMNPPLRSKADVAAILEGFADGTIDVIATDHAPHAMHEKETEFELADFGTIGLETALSLVITNLVTPGVLSLEEALAKMTIAPAAIMGMERWGYTPYLEAGSTANLAIFDPEAVYTVDPEGFFSRARNSAFSGMKLAGRNIHTVFNGDHVVCDSEPAHREQARSG